MKRFIAFVCFVFSISVQAQTGIGTTSPHPSAKLEVASDRQGFLPPRVTLTSTTDVTTIPNPAVGLLVYNNGTVPIKAGYYYWTGSNWATIATATSPDQTVDYAMASLTANQSLSAAGNVTFNTISGVGIALNNGGFNLLARKTYLLEAAMGGTSGGYAYYAWVDNTNTMLAGGSIGTIMKAGSSFTDAPQDKAVVYFTPTVNMTVYLRVLSVSGGVTAYAPNASSNYSSTWASITQIGSSAIINPWILNGTDVYNTTGNVGIGTSSPSSKLNVVGDVNVAGALNVSGSSNVNLQTPAVLVGTASGDEGGEMRLSLAQTNQSLNSNVIIDVYRNQLRFLEGGGTARGVNIDLSKAPSGASGELIWKASGVVNAGTFVTLDNIRATVPASGNRGLSIAATSTNFSANISAYYAMNGGVAGSATNNTSITTSASGSLFGWHFPTEGDGSYYTIVDKTNNRMYRITLMIGSGYNSNFISIERLF